jgi:oxalate decarboxylase/phosphoglucose isomerase-like protein (cupin superfamily)
MMADFEKGITRLGEGYQD